MNDSYSIEESKRIYLKKMPLSIIVHVQHSKYDTGSMILPSAILPSVVLPCMSLQAQGVALTGATLELQ